MRLKCLAVQAPGARHLIGSLVRQIMTAVGGAFAPVWAVALFPVKQQLSLPTGVWLLNLHMSRLDQMSNCICYDVRVHWCLPHTHALASGCSGLPFQQGVSVGIYMHSKNSVNFKGVPNHALLEWVIAD